MGQLGDLSPQGSVVVGVFVGLLSTSIQSLGLTLQRKSHILEDEKDIQDVRRPPYRRRRWQLGMLMFIVSNIVGSTIQITTLPLPVLSTLQASGLVFNSACATLILGEPFTRYSFIGTILVCAGAVLIAIFGAISEPAHTLDQLLRLLERRQFILWMIGQAILVLAIIVGARLLKLFNPYTSNSPRMRLIRGMSYGCISGILSAHSLLVAKSAVELLVRTIVDRQNQFNRWQSWMILLGLVALALCQLYYLHRGLKLCSTSILYPFVFCIYNIIAILDGLIYFHQTSRLSTLSALLIALGTVILLSGVLALSWRLNSEQTSPQAVPHTPLTPGMGIVSSPSPHSENSPLLPTSRSATFPSKFSNGVMRKPNFGTTSPSPTNVKRTSFDNSISTADLPSQRRHSSFRPPSSHSTSGAPYGRRSISARTRLRRDEGCEAEEIWDELEEEPGRSSRPGSAVLERPRSTGEGLSREDGEVVDEGLPLLSERRGKGMRYWERRRRRRTVGGGVE